MLQPEASPVLFHDVAVFPPKQLLAWGFHVTQRSVLDVLAYLRYENDGGW